MRLSPLATQNVHEVVYQRLKEGIVTNAFLPGEQLFVRELAEQLGTSTTPVVHAVLRLSQEGLVTVFPRKGTFVADLREEDIRRLFEAREGVEKHAAALAAIRVTPEHIDELRSILAHWSDLRSSLSDGVPSTNARALFEADSQFHLRVVELAGNAYMNDMYRKIDAHVWAFTRKTLSRYHADVQEVAHQGHLRIVDALARRDADAASDAVRAHIWDVHVQYARLMHPGAEAEADPPLDAPPTPPVSVSPAERRPRVPAGAAGSSRH